MDREKLAENIQTFVPLMFRKIMKVFPTFEISKQQIGLLFHVKHDNKKPMNFYSDKMMIPRSNLTVISDKLIEEGYIQRLYDPSDRRVVILEITSKGEECLNGYKEKVKKEMIKRLDVLNDEDIKRLNVLLEEMKTIFNKVDPN